MTKGNVMSGYVKPGFEAVPEAFAENFQRRRELGAACCIYHRGEKVVNLWGGVRDKATGAVGRGHHGDRVLRHQGSDEALRHAMYRSLGMQR